VPPCHWQCPVFGHEEEYEKIKNESKKLKKLGEKFL
jgi:hypothetical protein